MMNGFPQWENIWEKTIVSCTSNHSLKNQKGLISKKKSNEKCFQLCVFDQCSSEKMTDCPFFLDLGCISLRHMQVNQGQCTRFCLFDLHLTTDDCAVHSGPLIRGSHYTVSRNKTFLSYLILSYFVPRDLDSRCHMGPRLAAQGTSTRGAGDLDSRKHCQRHNGPRVLTL